MKMLLLCNCSHFVVGFLALFILGSWLSPIQLSDAAVGAYESDGYTGRSLLQTQQSCPVDFQSQNYSVITSQCKGPSYPPKPCCAAFKQFACQFVDEIDDVSTNCANTMFSYITLNGNYPPGLFANECKEGKEGLDCSNVTTTTTPSSNSTADSGGVGLHHLSTRLGLVYGSCAVGGGLLLLLL